MDPSFPPASSSALLEAAEEAPAVLPVQTIVHARVLKVLPVQRVVQGDDGVRRPRVQGRVVLKRKGRVLKKKNDFWVYVTAASTNPTRHTRAHIKKTIERQLTGRLGSLHLGPRAPLE